MAEHATHRHLHEAVGGFMIVMALVFLMFVIRAAFVHHWFSRTRTINVLMPGEGSFGLVEGSEVVVLGTRAGFVQRIAIGDDMRMRAIVEIRDDFAPFVKSRSQIMIRKTFGIAGETFLAIVGHEGRELDWKDDVLVAVPDRTTTERMDQVLEQIGGKLLPAIDKFREGIERWAEVADYLRDPDRDYGPLLQEMRTIADRLNQGEGALGRLLMDEAIASDLGELIDAATRATQDAAVVTARLRQQADTLPELIQRLHATMGDLQSIAADLGASSPQTMAGIRDAAERLPGLVLQVQQTALEIEQLAQGLRQRFAPDQPAEATTGRLSPEEAGP